MRQIENVGFDAKDRDGVHYRKYRTRVEYAGRVLVFEEGTTVEVADDVADYVRSMYAGEGLRVVPTPEEEQTARDRSVAPPPPPKRGGQPTTFQVLHQAVAAPVVPPPPPEPQPSAPLAPASISEAAAAAGDGSDTKPAVAPAPPRPEPKPKPKPEPAKPPKRRR